MSAWPLLDELVMDSSSTEHSIVRPDFERWIAIAFTPRCGSTAFCSILGKCGELGKPEEILNPRGPMQWLLGDATPSTLSEYFQYMADRVRTGNVCSFKTSWGDFAPLTLRSSCDPFLQRLEWIFLDRHDIRKQAASLARAQKSGRWHQKVHEKLKNADITITRNEITSARAALKLEKQGWASYFRVHGVKPLTFYYEDLVKDLSPALTAVAKLAGLSKVPDLGWGDSDYSKMSNNAQNS